MVRDLLCSHSLSSTSFTGADFVLLCSFLYLLSVLYSRSLPSVLACVFDFIDDVVGIKHQRCAGWYEVTPKLWRMTKRRMFNGGIGCDLICFCRPPLHVVPLLKLLSRKTVTHLLPTKWSINPEFAGIQITSLILFPLSVLNLLLPLLPWFILELVRLEYH